MRYVPKLEALLARLDRWRTARRLHRARLTWWKQCKPQWSGAGVEFVACAYLVSLDHDLPLRKELVRVGGAPLLITGQMLADPTVSKAFQVALRTLPNGTL